MNKTIWDIDVIQKVVRNIESSPEQSSSSSSGAKTIERYPLELQKTKQDKSSNAKTGSKSSDQSAIQDQLNQREKNGDKHIIQKPIIDKNGRQIGNQKPLDTRDIRDIINEAGKHENSIHQSQGQRPGQNSWSTHIENINRIPGSIDWEEELKKYFNSIIFREEEDVSYANLRKGALARDQISPDYTSIERVYGQNITVVVAVDSSGSVPDDEYAAFLGEIENLFDKLGGRVDGHILIWSTNIIPFDNPRAALDDILTKRYGAGGTDIGQVKQYIDQNKLEPNIVIYLTDGFVGGASTENVVQPNVFVITKSGTDSDILGIADNIVYMSGKPTMHKENRMSSLTFKNYITEVRKSVVGLMGLPKNSKVDAEKPYFKQAPSIPSHGFFAKDAGYVTGPTSGSTGLSVLNHKLLRSQIELTYKGQLSRNKSKALLIWGAPGIGKTTAVTGSAYLLAQQANKVFVDLSDIRKSAKDLEAAGLPVPGKDTTDWLVAAADSPEILSKIFVLAIEQLGQKNEEQLMGIIVGTEAGAQHTMRKATEAWIRIITHPDAAGIVFFDEFNLGSERVKNAAYEMLNERKISGKKVSDKVVIFAAGNGPLWLPDITRQRTQMSAPLQSRFEQVYLHVDPEAWLTEVAEKQNFHPLLLNYIKSDPKNNFWIPEGEMEKILKSSYEGIKGPVVGGVSSSRVYPQIVIPNPRSFEQLSNAMQDIAVSMSQEGADASDIINEFHRKAHQICGEHWANQFAKYIELMDAFDWDELVENPEKHLNFKELAGKGEGAEIRALARASQAVDYLRDRFINYVSGIIDDRSPNSIKQINDYLKVLGGAPAETVGQILNDIQTRNHGEQLIKLLKLLKANDKAITLDNALKQKIMQKIDKAGGMYNAAKGRMEVPKESYSLFEAEISKYISPIQPTQPTQLVNIPKFDQTIDKAKDDIEIEEPKVPETQGTTLDIQFYGNPNINQINKQQIKKQNDVVQSIFRMINSKYLSDPNKLLPSEPELIGTIKTDIVNYAKSAQLDQDEKNNFITAINSCGDLIDLMQMFNAYTRGFTLKPILTPIRFGKQ